VAGSGRRLHAQRALVVDLEDARSAFAVDEMTAEWLRAEQRIYGALAARFLPRLLGWEDGELPVLVLEDLSGADWTPPWTRERVDAVLATLQEIAETPPPPGLASLEDWREELTGWRKVERDPTALLALGVCSGEWLDGALPALLAAEDACVLEGRAAPPPRRPERQHLLPRGHALLADWSWAVRGNPVLDLAAWLPSQEPREARRRRRSFPRSPGRQPS
jgi:hypothetical protein